MTACGPKYCWPGLATALVVAAAAAGLFLQGRLWWCVCGRPALWTSDAWSSHTSQHLLDPYSLTHVLHGVLWAWVLSLCWPRLAVAWQLVLAVTASALWEVLENTDLVVQRFREATVALEYHGDTVANALGDILSCGVGFAVARWIGFWWSLALFVATEVALLVRIRDNLTLNVLMLLYPMEPVKSWQLGQ